MAADRSAETGVGFTGLVVSDWGAVWDRVKALRAGLDLEMPASRHHQRAAVQAYEAGELDAATIDAAYARVEAVLRRAANSLVDAPDSFDVESHHKLARRAAEQAVVLLSNDGVLPLARETKVAVVGEFARTPRYQGAGSSRVNPTKLDNALDAIQALVGHEVPFAPGFTTGGDQQPDADPIGEAVAVAREADVVLVFLGLGENHESEGYDRDSLDLPAEQLAVLDAVLTANPNVVVVLSNGSSVLTPFADRTRAVLEGWLLGQAGGPVLADVLYGIVNPSGKITETIPHRLADAPSFLHFPGDASGARYGEGLFVGYRGYDEMRRDVAFPFGHGLSYTTFEYTDLVAEASGNDVTVSVTVTNTGDRAGREVVQIYVAKTASEFVRVPRELKGFADVELEPGASETLTIRIPAGELAIWSVVDGRWVVEGGTYTVEVGASSRDLRAAEAVALPGDMPLRLLTLNSTTGEALAFPRFAKVLKQRMTEVLGDDLVTDNGLGTDTAKMMADIPLAGMAGFLGKSPEDFQQLLDAVNAERSA